MINQAISGMYKVGTGKPKRKMFSFRSPVEQNEESVEEIKNALRGGNRGTCVKVTLTKGVLKEEFIDLRFAGKFLGVKKNYVGKCERSNKRCRGWKVECDFIRITDGKTK